MHRSGYVLDIEERELTNTWDDLWKIRRVAWSWIGSAEATRREGLDKTRPSWQKGQLALFFLGWHLVRVWVSGSLVVSLGKTSVERVQGKVKSSLSELQCRRRSFVSPVAEMAMIQLNLPVWV